MPISAAPIAQLLLTVQFEPIAAGLSILDYAAIHEIFADDFPVFNQITRGGPMALHPATVVIEQNSGFPRLQFISDDLTTYILFQDDRVSVGWSRVKPLNENPEYPGFSKTLDMLSTALNKINGYLSEAGHPVGNPVVGEVIYTDSFNMNMPDGNVKQMQDIFKFFNSNPEFMFNQVNFTFRKVLIEPYEGQTETTVSGYLLGPNGETLVNLQTMVRVDLKFSHDDLSAPFLHARKAANEIFSLLVKPESYAI